MNAAPSTANPPSSGVDAEALVEELLRASRTFVGIAVRSLAAASVDVTVPQHRALVLVASDRVTSVGALAEELGVNQSNASRLVSRLVRMGLLARRRSTADGRANVLTVTGNGHQALDEVNQARRADIVALLKPTDLAGVVADDDVHDIPAATRVLAAFNAAAHEAPAARQPGD